MSNDIRSRLLHLETPLRTCKGLVHSIRSLAISVEELDADFANALDPVAAALADELAGIKDEWETITDMMQKRDAA